MVPDIERKLAALLSADVVGYSRLMAEDEAATIRTLSDYREEIAMRVRQHRGRVVDAPGDNVLAEFPTALDAVRCAVEIQGVLRALNTSLPDERRMDFRIGVHMGDVAVEGEKIYGDGVNIAARLEALAEAGGVCISATVHEQVRNKLDAGFTDLGDQTVKNIPDQVHVYRVQPRGQAEVPPRASAAPGKRPGRVLAISGTGILRAAAIAAALVLVALTGWWLSRQVGTSGPIRSLAVLPLDNLSGDPEQEYFTDGMTEALIANLARVDGLRVISRTSSMAFKNSNRTLPQIARELNVEAIVEGSVLRAGDRVRITTQLIRADSDEHLWSDSYERDLEDVLSLQSEVAQAIAGEIELSLAPADPDSGGEVDPAAFEAYLKGRHHWNRRISTDIRRSIEYFEAAIERDPSWALAHSAIAEAYVVLPIYDLTADPHVAMPRARASAERALELDDGLAAAHSALGGVLAWYEWDRRGAEAAFKRALDLDPSYALARTWYSILLASQGRDGLEESLRARELDPLSMIVATSPVTIAFFSRDFDRAIDLGQQALELDPNFIEAGVRLSRVYSAKGMHEEAVALSERTVQAHPTEPRSLGALAEAYANAGRADAALRIVAEIPAGGVDPRDLAAVYAALGDSDAAFEWLEKAFEHRSIWISLIDVDPSFDSLRDDPRFDDLLIRLGFRES